MPDFAAIASTLLERFRALGLARVVTLRRLNSTPPDPQQPWIPAVDPRAGATTLSVTAAFVDPSSERELGLDARIDDWLKRATQIAIVASTSDLGEFSELVDTDASVWRIEGVKTLRPGPTRIVHFLGVAR